ncbi:hypothetical protein AVEN_126119-1 [Araneus ventricosus]|uniref:Uncharacterized protein n=1 Tax=Araneus ventricosus TaxID=182803 RepID=A0A4Y2PMH9_ARAVE|nr:hypothetical protein AVEN_126119-1 [Araneus ventricosus]
MLNRDSAVKSTWPHCSGVQLRCSRAQCNRALTCAGTKHQAETTGRRANRYSFMQDARYSLEGYEPSCSSGELRRYLSRCYCPPASGKLQQVAIVCHCGDSPASRPTSSTGVLIPLIMVPQPMDDTTMHIQLSGNSRLSCTNLQHTDSSPTHLILQMLSYTHAFRFGYLGFRGTIAACELKHRSFNPLLRRCGVTTVLRFMLILVAYLRSAMQPLPHT